jgi:PAS domain-containing protein
MDLLLDVRANQIIRALPIRYRLQVSRLQSITSCFCVTLAACARTNRKISGISFGFIVSCVYVDSRFQFRGGKAKPTYTTIQDLTALVPMEEQQGVRDAILGVVKGLASSTYKITHRARKPDGKFIRISSEGRVTKRDRDGRALHMIGINRDITENNFADQE